MGKCTRNLQAQAEELAARRNSMRVEAYEGDLELAKVVIDKLLRKMDKESAYLQRSMACDAIF
jgi:hypothetical protein